MTDPTQIISTCKPDFQKLLILFVVLLWQHRANCDTYQTLRCEYQKCGDQPHSMCVFPRYLDRSAKKCNRPEATAGMLPIFRRVALDRHNQLRQAVAQGRIQGQPPAANMRKLKWSVELENIAQRFVNSCPTVSYYSCRNLKDGTYVGENSGNAYYHYKKYPIKSAFVRSIVDIWFRSHKHMNPAYIKDIRSAGEDMDRVFPYAQLAWADTDRLGCGYLEYNYDDFEDQFMLMNCLYAKAAQLYVKGAKMYEEGEPCSRCPAGYRCSGRYPGLCTDEHDEFRDIPAYLDHSELERLEFTTRIHVAGEDDDDDDDYLPDWCGAGALAAAWGVVLPPLVLTLGHVL